MSRSPDSPGSGANPEDWDPKRFLAGVNARVNAFERTRRAQWWEATRWARAIAAGVVLAAAGALTWATLERGPVASGPYGGGRSYVTAAAQRARITLPDGTRITLAPASRLTLSARYDRGERQIDLEGEAYFAVQHDAAHPFVVRAGSVATRDVGTAFDVSAYHEDRRVRVAVVEGAVAVAAGTRADQDRAVRAGDIATVTDGGVAVAHSADVAALTAWMQGDLLFRDTPLTDVVRQLARMYDLDVRIADTALARETVTGSLLHVSADEALEAVARAVGARVERHGRQAAFVPGGTAASPSLPGRDGAMAVRSIAAPNQ